jgi:hypothetical protein
MRRTLFVIAALLCLVASAYAQISKYTPEQMQAAVEAMQKDPHLLDNKLCDMSGTDIKCFIAFNRTLFGERVVFNASIEISVNVDNQTAEVIIAIDNTVMLDKIYALKDLDVPICVPVINPIQFFINLCADITGIKFSKEKDCWKAALGVELIILKVFKLTLIPPQQFGHNVAKCQ